ncbi:MAG: phosphatidate cytidylyltransferase [Clostridiales bacterium]|nr:phosphatidate cytidylyltransferase [Butyricicoccus pullicaecorum]MCI6720600.1 phosphatidate cytidylyltransferase [Clostridiales bacterium]
MKKRVIFGVVGLIFVLLALYRFPPIVLEAALAALSALATYELLGSTRLVRDRVMLALAVLYSLTYAFSLSTMAKAQPYSAMLSHILLTVFLLALFARLLQKHATVGAQEAACAAFGGICLPYLLLSLIRIFQIPQIGPFLVLLPLVAAWGSDTCALFAGILFGKHKLAPVVSPKKTVEGAVGGVVGATVIMLAVVAVFNRFTPVDIPFFAAAVLGAVGAVIGQLGDLTFSVIKRQTGIKDYGHIFPGHGGVLDRFDSVIFVAPVVELVLQILEQLG